MAVTLTPAVLFCRGMRSHSDTPPQTPTKAQRYNLFRLKTTQPPVNNHPWKHLQRTQ